MSDTRKIVQHVLAILAFAAVVSAAANLSLIRRMIRGEFRETFLGQAEYPGIRLVGLGEAEDLFFQPGKAVFIDARPAKAYGAGHIPGAKNVSPGVAGENLPEEITVLARELTLLVYCEGGDCLSSLAVAKVLHALGFTDIRVFSGGFEEWKKAGRPEEKAGD